MADRVKSDQTSDINEMWAQFKASGSEKLRENLILHYSPLVKFVAGRVAAGLPRNVDQNDLASYGIFGLIDAIDKFEPERGFKFETYAINRIKGAILDELRSFDWVPRSVRAKAREIERSIVELEHRLKRSPTDEELAEHMETDVESVQNDLSEISLLGIAALDQTRRVGGEHHHPQGPRRRSHRSIAGGRIPGRGDPPPARRLDQPAPRQGAAGRDPLLLRGPDPRRDR
jgi:RNA polymerase sigma factor FliA